jgi:hypothetical protein
LVEEENRKCEEKDEFIEQLQIENKNLREQQEELANSIHDYNSA